MEPCVSNDSVYPFAIEPKETPAIWGGDALVKRFGKKADPNAKIGESWECWDENRVLNGPLAGKTIADLRAQLGATLLGDLDPQQLFPILTKIIDARDALSVQVHPDDAYAQRVEHQHNGKTECWYILSANEGAELVYGWKQDTTREEYERRVADGTLGDILRRVPVKAGETYYLPAGTLHAIGAGIILFETQQASDLTYRIFDWNRVGADGKPRELNVTKAADVLDYHQGARGAAETIAYHYEGLDRTALVASSRFHRRTRRRDGRSRLAGNRRAPGDRDDARASDDATGGRCGARPRALSNRARARGRTVVHRLGARADVKRRLCSSHRRRAPRP